MWFRVFTARTYAEKAFVAEQVASHFDTLLRLQELLREYFHKGTFSVFWDPQLTPVERNVIVEGVIDEERLDEVLIAFSRHTRMKTVELWHAISPQRSLHHLTTRLQRILPSCADLTPSEETQYPLRVTQRSAKRHRVSKAFNGPLSAHLDPSLKPEYSLLEFAAPVFCDDIRAAVPYFWTLASREAMVCDSCALSGIEYDGLPLRFYYDMARQAADEARHAAMFLALSKELMPELLLSADVSDKLRVSVTDHLQRLCPLPIPQETGLFRSMWNSSLTERLILMQIDTEGPAVAGAKRAARGGLANQFPGVRKAFEIDYFDEIAHARIGHRWLKHLLPSAESRQVEIQSTRLLRGVLLLTSFVSEANDMTDLVQAYGGGATLPQVQYFH